jgi:hypothetical protein
LLNHAIAWDVLAIHMPYSQGINSISANRLVNLSPVVPASLRLFLRINVRAVDIELHLFPLWQ